MPAGRTGKETVGLLDNGESLRLVAAVTGPVPALVVSSLTDGLSESLLKILREEIVDKGIDAGVSVPKAHS